MKVKRISTKLEQLLQIAVTPIWDGDLISKNEVKRLKESGFVKSMDGFNIITCAGISVLNELDLIKR